MSSTPFLSTLQNVLHLDSRRLFQKAQEFFVYEAQCDQALSLVEQGLNREPGNVQGLVLRADILYCLKRDDEALQTLHRALRLKPNCAEALMSKASVLEAIGQHTEALRHNRLALRQLRSRHRYLLPTLYGQQINLLVRLNKAQKAVDLLKQAQSQLAQADYNNLEQELVALMQQLNPLRTERLKQAGNVVLRVITGQAS
jgi:tetratricopeptide (TPR) repeat protein